MKAKAMHTPSTAFDTHLEMIREIYEEKIPFNKVLGLKVLSMTPERARVRFKMDRSLVGNYVFGILHGGVISATLDATGGLIASLGILVRLVGASQQEIKRRVSKVGTIDLRIDYLRPGQGEYFDGSASIMRAGRKVTVTRMELHNDQGLLIAVGTGTYIVG